MFGISHAFARMMQLAAVSAVLDAASRSMRGITHEFATRARHAPRRRRWVSRGFSGAALREMNARNGVGRPPRLKKYSRDDLTRGWPAAYSVSQ